VIDRMGVAYPELMARREYITRNTRAEEERFLATIDAGIKLFDQLAPVGGSGTIAGADVFKLYDTFGFPIDLTELMARERGYTVDIDGFDRALEAQRAQSREDRKARDLTIGADALADLEQWERLPELVEAVSNFVGYDVVHIETQVTAVRRLSGGRIAVMLRETPFYAESGGQISDHGEIVGEGWRVDVDEVKKIDGRIAAIGKLTGEFRWGRVTASVPTDRRRDTERNHTATHLLHAALRTILGEHVHQAGSLVAPDRLRFDFTHHGPVRPEALVEIEEWVNRGIWADIDLQFREVPYKEAVAAGAMALFGEKYGDVVRVVSIPGLSMELCGGTHARNTGQIALFKIVSETGVAAGVRRIEAVTGPRAYAYVREEEQRLQRIAELVKGQPATVVSRVEGLLDERRALQRRLEEVMRGGGDQVASLVSRAQPVDGTRLVSAVVSAGDVKELQAMGDALRERLGSGIGVIGASFGDGKTTLLVVVTDDLRERGVRADELVRAIAAVANGRGGGKPHMAQAGIPDAARLPEAIERAPELVRPFLAKA
ncbi:MAG TPA: alanine--tRNA ligase-related protein, partial [Gemmatimonadaceae bacterium]|nr:alanine--tRNA ligase-related protein [Gemmatimonadaceae bacterium]